MTAPVLPIGERVDPFPALRPARTRLDGRHVALLPFSVDAHAADLYEGSCGSANDGLWAYMAQGPFADFGAFRDYYAAAAQKDDPLLFAIVDQTSGRAVGHATFMRITPADRVIEVGNILYTPALQRTVGATEAMYLMARHAFEYLGYRRYEWKCNALNAPSWRAAIRLGFTYEGTFRQHMIIKGHNRDTAWFSLLDHEWPRAKGAFEAWLDPVNFGPDGRQLHPLEALRDGLTARPGAIALRRGAGADRDALVVLQSQAYAPNRAIIGGTPTPLTWDYADILDRFEVWLAEDESGLVGALILETRVDDVYIQSIAVAPHAKGHGLGNRLLAHAVLRAIAADRSTLRLTANALLKSNVDWYGRQGFVVEQIETADGRRRVRMGKTLSV